MLALPAQVLVIAVRDFSQCKIVSAQCVLSYYAPYPKHSSDFQGDRWKCLWKKLKFAGHLCTMLQRDLVDHGVPSCEDRNKVFWVCYHENTLFFESCYCLMRLIGTQQNFLPLSLSRKPGTV